MLVAAGDTFRAGAIDQLRVWATGRVRSSSGASPAPIRRRSRSTRSTPAMARGADVVIIDTAGRLHTSDELMDGAARRWRA